MSKEWLARILFRYFEEQIWIPTTRRGEECLLWTWEQILRHIQFHMMDPETMLSNKMEELHEKLTIISDTVIVSANGNPLQHDKHIKNYNALLKTFLSFNDRVKRQ